MAKIYTKSFLFVSDLVSDEVLACLTGIIVHDKYSFTLRFWSCLRKSNIEMLSYELRKETTIQLLIRLPQH